MRRIDYDLLRKLAPVFKDHRATHHRHASNKGTRQQQNLFWLSIYLDPIMMSFQINTFFRRAHFLGQICVESGDFVDRVEHGSGMKYEYAKRLGNTEKGDGPRYKGRGYIQLTGRFNYTSASSDLDLDLVNNPSQAADQKTAVQTACLFWSKHGLNAIADRDDVILITKTINGGDNQLPERMAAMKRAKKLLSEPTPSEAQNALVRISLGKG